MFVIFDDFIKEAHFLNEIYIFLLFILTGISIGILFDIFRILRRSFKTIDFITYIQDFLFWILAGAILLYSIFSFNNGELRGYIFIGVILGVILYMLSLSKYIIRISVTIIKILKKIIYVPTKYIFNVFSNCLIKLLHYLGMKFTNLCLKTRNSTKNHLQKLRKNTKLN